MPSPFDDLLSNLRDAIEDTAKDFLKEVNREAKSTIRQMSRQAVRVRANPQVNRRTPGRQTVPKPHSPVPVSPTPQKTLYDHLEVVKSASPETVSAAFRSLSARFHPDNQKTGNAEKYKAITEAWATLKDVKKRREYDRSLK